MVSEFGFSSQELGSHTTTARSYLAYPLRFRGSTIGALYFFSTEPQVFPRAVDPEELERSAGNVIGVLRTAEVF